MKQIVLGKNGPKVPQIGLGCMRLTGLQAAEAERLIRTAMELGVCFFDHADIYGGDGACESFFAESCHMTPALREQMILQTKCGIRSGFFDFSKEHILNSVEASLRRLKTDYLDVLLLHRPDTLMEPEEVAEAFRLLRESGKVRFFGVSNQNPGQMALLNEACGGAILVNQLQLSIAHCGMIDAGLNVNMENGASVDHDNGVLEYCRLHHITIQAWSPFQYGMFEGVFLGNTEKFAKLNEVAERIARKYGVTPTAIAVAWISRHPAKIQTIVGTTNAQRLREICASDAVTLTREEWYELYLAAGKRLP